jgi:isopenicillin-N N-acyltransferase-like protein
MKNEKVEDVPTIKAYGSPYQVGLVYGEKAKDRILMNLESFKIILQEVIGLSWGKLRETSKRGLDEIRSFNDKAVEVMNGIADGAKLPFEDILTINYRYELLFSKKDSCTSIGVQSDGLAMIAQNWDLNREIEKGIVNLEFKIDNNPKVLTQVEAGSLSHRGLNSEGVALCINALKSKEDGRKLGVPLVSILSWSILNSKNLTKAFELIQEAKRSSSINFLMAKKDLLLDVEITPADAEYIEPDEHGLIVHTNHFLCSRFKYLNRNVSSCSWTRQLRANYLIKKLGYKVDVNDVKNILRDHYDLPFSICRHASEEPGVSGAAKTLASTIFDIGRSEYHYTIGNPCMSEYKRMKML